MSDVVIRKCKHCSSNLNFFHGKTGEKAGMEIAVLSAKQIKSLYFAKCPDCLCVYHPYTDTRKYEAEYFEEEYKNQYGCNYSEDRENIHKINQRRLKKLMKYIPANAPKEWKVLELGCAYGYFLEILHDKGFNDLFGIDISKHAIKNAQKKDFIQYKQISVFDFFESNKEKFDMIISLYFLEHVSDQQKLFSEISDNLNDGGFFYFAVPSVNGPQFEFQINDWFENHPHDHFTDYSPESLRKILPMYGLRPINMNITSYHPERLNGVPATIKYLGEFGKSLYKIFSDIALFGDIIECIAKKE